MDDESYIFSTVSANILKLKTRLKADHRVMFGKSKDIIDFALQESFTIAKNKERYNNKNITGLIIIPTWGCKSKCGYCYTKNADTKKILTIDKLEAVIKKYNIDPDKIQDTVIIGGEPLLNPDLVRYALNRFRDAKHTICTALETDHNTVMSIAELAITLPSVEFSISVDADNSQRYIKDPKRKEAIIKQIQDMASIGADVRIKSVISPGAWDISNLRKETGIDDISCDGVGYSEDGTIFDEPSLNGIVDMFSAELEDIIHGKRQLDQSLICFGQTIDYILYNDFKYPVQNCGCGVNHFTITPDGELSICDSPGHEPLDVNLNSNELEEKAASVKAPCNTCYQFSYCGGACEVYSTGKYNFFCTIRQLKFAYTLYAEILRTR